MKKNLLKHNVPVPLSKVVAFLDARLKKTSPEESARIANELIEALEQAVKKIEDGYNDKNLTVCIGKAAHVSPEDLQKFIAGKIPCLTLYRHKKDTRHMPLYMKHVPSFYAANKPIPKPGARNKAPRKPVKKEV